MSVTNESNSFEHENANCNCASCKQLRKPAKIVSLPSLLFQQRDHFVNNVARLKTAGTGTTQARNNVISLSAAIQSAEHMRIDKIRQAQFKYPMLECF